VLKAYKFRVYPDEKQMELILKCCGCARLIYNKMLWLQQINYENTGKNLSHKQISTVLTALKKEKEFAFLKEVDSVALQSATEHLRDAFDAFFKGRGGYPNFKKKRHYCSYSTKNVNDNIKLEDKYITLPKVGRLKAKVHRAMKGVIKNATISVNNAGHVYVSLCCLVKDEKVRDTSSLPKAGIDLGLKDFVITSEGTKYENMKFLKKEERRIARLQRRLSRKQKGSKNQEKARLALARKHQKIANRRMDYLHKLTHEMVMSHSFIAVETLKVKNMVKNHHLAQAISDVSWSEFVRMLEYKCQWCGVPFQKVNIFFASSQICNHCGFKNPVTKDLNVREVTCPMCGEVYDRDINAAKNILNEGLRLYY